ncbi:MAG: beta-glucuronidase [Ruminococcus sp.]|nr:beta-glucuronidase [Ruminococcus sp.]
MKKINLADTPWDFAVSTEKPDINEALTDTVILPSTVQQMKKTPVTDERSDGYLTDPHSFEGYALYRRNASVNINDDEEAFLVLERTRTSNVWINGSFAGSCSSICAPHIYNITELVTGNDVITVMIDNISCPVPGGHMTSKDTQTNWLGITGEVSVRIKKRRRFDNVRIFPDISQMSIRVAGRVTGGGSLQVTAEAEGYPEKKYELSGDKAEFIYEMKNARLWSEHDPVTYRLKLSCSGDSEEITFGMREFSVKGAELLLNGEKIFLRGKHDGMIFPLTGAAPTDKADWLKVMGTAKEYGINHYRFHTCCPPEAAFEAADELGIYLEPELPFWGTVEDELTDPQRYLVDEGFRILDAFGNHPSFFALSLGNELWGSKERLNAILGDYKKHDSRPLYTQGSNNFQFWPCILENDDLFVGVRFSKERLFRGSYAMCDAPLGHIQTDAPNSDYTYDEHIRPSSISKNKPRVGTIQIQYGTGVKTVSVDNSDGEFVSHIPVISHEVGQYFMYPDYNEISKYTGVLKPYNLEIFKERLEKAGLLHLADKYFHASGSFAAQCYKMEIETAMRSKELSGFQLLDIQDFTGQGTALVGILNSFMESKGVISNEAWRRFMNDRVILGCLPKFVYAYGEKIGMGIKLFQYGGKADVDPEVTVTVKDGDISLFTEKLAVKGSFKGGVFDLGNIEIDIPSSDEPRELCLTVTMNDISNCYNLWLYPQNEETEFIAESEWKIAKEKLKNGEDVLFIPKSINEEHSIEGTYCTDFWNYPMFRSISESMKKPVPVGTLGLLIDSSHPALKEFPCRTYSTEQWYDIVSSSRTVILDGTGIEPIVRTIDNCERNHSLGTVFEVNAGGGRLLVCTAALEDNMSSLPCRRLLTSLTNYIKSGSFAPVQTVDLSVLDKIFS